MEPVHFTVVASQCNNFTVVLQSDGCNVKWKVGGCEVNTFLFMTAGANDSAMEIVHFTVQFPFFFIQ